MNRTLLILITGSILSGSCSPSRPEIQFPPSCMDRLRNGQETDVDCGGTCVPCAEGRACQTGRDCTSGVCREGSCRPPACADGIKNGDEVDVDCGGSCPRCAPGAACGQASHCDSGVCLAGRCQGPSCTDGVKNGSETDRDCGGSCGGCSDGGRCGGGQDCASRVCQSGLCRASACSDGVQNGSETDRDCGGSCGGCAQGQRCNRPGDCSSGTCVDGLCAQPEIVHDGVSRRWSDGTLATACHTYIRPPPGYRYAGAIGNGRYTVDPDGPGGQTPFDVYCDMTTHGGGWTLVDNDASTTTSFTTREPGANPDILVTRGSYLPAYLWSDRPQLLCVASVFTGQVGWLTLNALGPLAREYPTSTTPMDTTYSDQWQYDVLNGNTPQGTTAWIYRGSGRFGSVWIGNGGQPTCACDYYAPSSSTGLGTYASGPGPTCSTWVR